MPAGHRMALSNTLALALTAAVIAALLPVASADLPIHCIRSDVLGKWTFHHSAQTFTKDVDCSKFSKAGEIELDLSMPNVAKDKDGNEGTWTMIYDEGLEVRINGNKFFSFFEFKRPDFTESSMHRSFCGMTLRSQGGSFHDNNGAKWGCFHGEKQAKDFNAVTYVSHDGKKNWEPCQSSSEHKDDCAAAAASASSSSSSDVPDEVLSPVARHNVVDDENNNADDEEESADVNSMDDLEKEIHADDAMLTAAEPANIASDKDDETVDDADAFDLDEAENDLELDVSEDLEHEDLYKSESELVDLINLSQSSYKAKLYPELYEGKRISQLTLMAGGIPYKQIVASHKAAAAGENIAINNLEFGTYEEDFDAGLPESWDWRNVNGENYLFEPINQGMCGSCFAVATTDMIQTRARIVTKNSFKKQLAVQDILSCGSRYAQGCKGGFPYLASKFVEDYGITTAACMKYRAETGSCPSSRSCHKEDRVYAKNYHYVGGYYGACTAREMMKEIMNHGPIVVGFQANMALMHYSSGVFLEMEDVDDTAKNFFEPTNHAVLAIGWGVEKESGKKYWVVKNSWGAKWGEGGYFRIERGRDTAHFESMAVAAEPVIPANMMQ